MSSCHGGGRLRDSRNSIKNQKWLVPGLRQIFATSLECTTTDSSYVQRVRNSIISLVVVLKDATKRLASKEFHRELANGCCKARERF